MTEDQLYMLLKQEYGMIPDDQLIKLANTIYVNILKPYKDKMILIVDRKDKRIYYLKSVMEDRVSLVYGGEVD